MLLLLDNYDSFTYNLYDYFVRSGAEVEVVRNDKLDLSSVEHKYDGIIISPGPGVPADAGCTMDIIDRYHLTKPIFGVCLGMQALGLYFGAQLRRAVYPMHGKVSTLEYDETNLLFQHIDSPLDVCRYHSLVLDQIDRTELKEIAKTKANEPMAIQHKSLPIFGVQFHPEAILSVQGLQIIQNWVSSLTLQCNNTR